MSFQVVGIGEVLWDVLPEGKRLGGAPANFACHAQSLGAEASIVSAVGEDLLGRELLQSLVGRGFQQETVAIDSEHPTGTASVTMSGDGLPNYQIHEDAAWDHLVPTLAAIEAVKAADAVCFGSLAQRHAVSRDSIRALLQAVPGESLKVFDVNLRQRYYDEDVVRESFELANVVKLNEEELPVVSKLLSIADMNDRACLTVLSERFGLRAVALTRGGDGSLLLANGEWSDVAGQAVKVADTVGAGDSFLAAMVMGLLHGKPLATINEHANAIARHVCGCEGATPTIPDILRHHFQPAA